MKEQMDTPLPAPTQGQIAGREQELKRQRAEMTPEGRIAEFAYTGNPEWLLPSDCTPGFLEAGGLEIEGEHVRFHGQERSLENQIQDEMNYLELSGVDVARIDVDNPQATVAYLLPFLQKRISDIQEPVLHVREAIESLLDLMTQKNPEGFLGALVTHIDLSPQVFSASRKTLKLLAHAVKKDPTIWNTDIAHALQSKLDNKDNSALLEMLASDVVQDCDSKEFSTFEQQPIIQAGKDVYATLSGDGDRLYVVPQEYLSQLHHALQEKDIDTLWDIRDATVDAGEEPDISFTYERQAYDLEGVENMLDDYMYFVSDRGQAHAEKLLGIQSNSQLSLQENMQILHHLKQTTVSEAKELKELITTYGIDSLRSFLALNEDESLGNTIREIGSKFDEDTARKLFAKYAEIIDASEDAREYAAEALNEGASADAETYVHDIAKNLRHKANDLLRDAQHALTTENIEPLLVKLDAIKAENLLWASVFREYSRAGVPIEDFRNTSLEVKEARGVSEADRTAMRAMLTKNYESYHNPEFEKAILESMEAKFDNPDTRFYLLKHNDQITGFDRFDDIRDSKTGEVKERYFGSFNVERMQFGGNGIGNAILKASFEHEVEHGVPIRAHCDPHAIISQKYIEWGFVAQRIEDVHGVPSFTIVFDTAHNETLESKKWTAEEVISRATGSATTENIRIQTVTRGTAPDFTLLQQGYVLSRFFSEQGTTYCVFEKD